jgi:hypothetical protein
MAIRFPSLQMTRLLEGAMVKIVEDHLTKDAVALLLRSLAES